MRIIAPSKAIDFEATDIYGNTVKLHEFKERAIVLSFFRDASCPLCLKRVFELRARRKQWKSKGIEIIAVFNSSEEQIKKYSEDTSTRFTAIADPDLVISELYGVEKSSDSFFKTLRVNMLNIFSGAKADNDVTKNTNGTIIPADFLIDHDGAIVDLWYGSHETDHMPMNRIDGFVQTMLKKIKP